VIDALNSVDIAKHSPGVNRPSKEQVRAFIQTLEQISTCTILYAESEGEEGNDLVSGIASLGSSKFRLAVAWLSAKLMAGRSPEGESNPNFGIQAFFNSMYTGGASVANTALGAAGSVLEHGGDVADFTEAVTGCSAEIEKRALVLVKLFVNMYHVLVSADEKTIKKTSQVLSAVKLSALSAEEQDNIDEANELLKQKQSPSFGANPAVAEETDEERVARVAGEQLLAPASASSAATQGYSYREGAASALGSVSSWTIAKKDAVSATLQTFWAAIVDMFTSLPNTLLNLAKKGAGGSVINLFGDLAQKLLERI
jgi:hypothetical protein